MYRALRSRGQKFQFLVNALSILIITESIDFYLTDSTQSPLRTFQSDQITKVYYMHDALALNISAFS